MNDDIEFLDIFDSKKAAEPVKNTQGSNLNNQEENSSNPSKKNKKKKIRIKARAWQLIFCVISFLFLMTCLVYYGSRFIKYYRIYNPKIDSSDGSVLLSQDIIGKTEYDIDAESGLFNSSGSYLYKGDVSNNYLKFNNMLWRIIRINADNTMEIILDDYINILPWNSEVTSFENADIYKYLNENFLNNLDKNLLVKTSFCKDAFTDLNKKTCENDHYSESYVKLLDVIGYLNSVKSKKTYLSHSDEIFWLSDYNSDKIWHTNGVNVSQSDANTFYEIRPVVKLKNTVTYKTGDGTKDNPYLVGDDNTLKLGSIVSLDNDQWIVYDVDKDVKLMKTDLLEKKQIFDKKSMIFSESSLKEYLNTTYLDSLSYKDKLVESNWYVGKYSNKIEDVVKAEMKAKVSIPNILDIKFDSSTNGYFTSTANDEVVWVYENPLRPSRITSSRSIRVCVAISKDYAKTLVYQDGVFKEA